jgi:hypothetical protein
MISWKWLKSNENHYHSGHIEYNQKTYQALPMKWSVKVSDPCTQDSCNIKVIVYGEKCPPGGCDT